MISQRDLDLYLDKVAELQVVLMRAEDLCDILEDDHIDLIDVDEVRHYNGTRAFECATVYDFEQDGTDKIERLAVIFGVRDE